MEIGYAAEKSTNPVTRDDRDAILAVLSDPESPFEVVPDDFAIAARVQRPVLGRAADCPP